MGHLIYIIHTMYNSHAQFLISCPTCSSLPNLPCNSLSQSSKFIRLRFDPGSLPQGKWLPAIPGAPAKIIAANDGDIGCQNRCSPIIMNNHLVLSFSPQTSWPNLKARKNLSTPTSLAPCRQRLDNIQGEVSQL